MGIDDIILKEDFCTITSSRVRRLYDLQGYIATGIVILAGSSLLASLATDIPVFVIVAFVIGVLCYMIMFYYSVKRLKTPPAPIVITKNGVTLPNGKHIQWKAIKCIKFDYMPYAAMPLLHIEMTNHAKEELPDWYLYSNKKKLVLLFEKYAGRKLFLS